MWWEERRLEIELEQDEIEYGTVEYHCEIECDHYDGVLIEVKGLVVVLRQVAVE